MHDTGTAGPGSRYRAQPCGVIRVRAARLGRSHRHEAVVQVVWPRRSQFDGTVPPRSGQATPLRCPFKQRRPSMMRGRQGNRRRSQLSRTGRGQLRTDANGGGDDLSAVPPLSRGDRRVGRPPAYALNPGLRWAAKRGDMAPAGPATKPSMTIAQALARSPGEASGPFQDGRERATTPCARRRTTFENAPRQPAEWMPTKRRNAESLVVLPVVVVAPDLLGPFLKIPQQRRQEHHSYQAVLVGQVIHPRLVSHHVPG